MGIFDSLTGKPAARAAEQNRDRLSGLRTEGLGYLDRGTDFAIKSLEGAKSAFDPLTSLAGKYGQGSDLYMDSLGINGAGGNERAVSAFQAGPGYDFAVNQSLDALDRRAASRGMLASGNTTLDTLGTVTGLANQEYGNWQNRLGGFMAPELAATGAVAGGLAGLEAGKAPIYTNDATQRVNLASNVTNGLNSQTTQQANAQMQASGNMLNLGMDLAKMVASGGTSMLGGGGSTGAKTFNLGGSAGAIY